MWIPRRAESAIVAAAHTRPVVVVTGARQVGKSSLLSRCFPGHHVVSLDLPSEAELAEQAPDELLARHPLPLIVDEVQYAPTLLRHLKRVVDADRGQRGQILLTGSQRFALMQHVSESLAGRAAILELDPLDFSEVASASPGASLAARILRGGYPELWAAPEIDARAFHAAYVATYLERDLRSMLRVGSLRDFERFVRACALRSGQLLNKSELARDVGIAGSTANEWLSVLDASGIVALLEPWFANAGKRLVKSPKLYFRDTGLLCFLLNVRDEADLSGSPLRGAIFETAVYGELRKRLARTDEVSGLFFYRDQTVEVDFLLHRAGRFELIESKWTELPGDGDVAHLTRLAKQLGEDRVAGQTLLCRTPTPTRRGATRITTLDDWQGP